MSASPPTQPPPATHADASDAKGGKLASAVEDVKQKASDTLGQVRNDAEARVEQTQTAVMRASEKQRIRTAHGVGEAAQAGREIAERLRSEDRAAAAGWVDKAADAVDASGRYLHENDLQAIGRQGVDLAKRYPLAAVTGGLVLGLAASRVAKAWYDGLTSDERSAAGHASTVHHDGPPSTLAGLPTTDQRYRPEGNPSPSHNPADHANTGATV